MECHLNPSELDALLGILAAIRFAVDSYIWLSTEHALTLERLERDYNESKIDMEKPK
jgi:hypothetical protein